jgi:hypothetical protein
MELDDVRFLVDENTLALGKAIASCAKTRP